MATPEVIEIERLLEPIEGDDPVGIDLRADESPTSAYQKIKQARSEARALEREAVKAVDGEFPTGLKEWQVVMDIATELLARKSKDLEVAAWLTEALVRGHGFSGLRGGFRLTREMVDQYWDAVYPRLPDGVSDEEAVSDRVAALTGLNGADGPGTLVEPLNNVVITEGRSCGPFRMWHYRQARDLAGSADDEARAKGTAAMDQIDVAVQESDPQFFVTLIDDLESCVEEYGEFTRVLDEKCKKAAPPSSNIRNALEETLQAVRYLSRDVVPQVVETGPEEDDKTAAAGGGGRAAGGAVSGGVGSREEALAGLSAVAEYFLRTEPHSPISYILRQAVRWAQMPLPQLLAELIPDDNARTTFFKLTGIKSRDGTES